MSEIIITVDLGTINAYEIVRDPFKVESDRLEIIKSYVTHEPLTRASKKYSNSSGKFYQGGGTSGTTSGAGEQHAVEIEAEKRLIKKLAQDINELVSDKNCNKWFLAADRSINKQLLEYLTPGVRAKLKKNVAANLTKFEKTELVSYFV